MIKSDAEIYKELERVLRATGDTPITAVHIFEADAKVRELAVSANRLSDYLGHMWRRGVVQRYYAANDKTRARYAYTWKDEGVVTPQKLAAAKSTYLTSVKPATTGKSGVHITESEGTITLDFADFTITVQRK